VKIGSADNQVLTISLRKNGV